MGQDKKQLTKLLAFVKDLYDHPDNKEYAAGIQAIVLRDLSVTTKEDIEKIKEVLQLKADISVDYSFVKDTFVQKQLIIDNLRMENALLNLSMPEQERYNCFVVNAFLQVENILNYYYRTKFQDNINNILLDIELATKNDKYPFVRAPGQQYTYVSDIPIAKKIQAFCNSYFPFKNNTPDYVSLNLQKMRSIRNDTFHRAGLTTLQTSAAPVRTSKTSTSPPTPNMFRDSLKKLVGKIKGLV